MSGGSYDYFFRKIDNFTDELELKNDQRRIAFKSLLELISNACHAIEWEDSCDSRKDGTDEAIDKVFEFLKADPELIAKAHSFDQFKIKMRKFLELDKG